MLESNGLDLRQRRYIDRFSGLLMLLPNGQPALRWVSTAIEPTDKLETYAEIRQANGEGVVFKDMNAPFSPGRPNSGGPQLKFKFVETASFIVTDINTKRSVTLGLTGTPTSTPLRAPSPAIRARSPGSPPIPLDQTKRYNG